MNDPIALGEKMPGSKEYKSEDYTKKTSIGLEAHQITSFENEIRNLPTGRYTVVNGRIVPQ